MVLTQFELKSCCWSEDNKTDSMSVSTDILFQTNDQVVNECLERNSFPQSAQNGYHQCIVSSNGYYGYQPLTASMKQENFTYNDCEMSMNCDNVQENIMENPTTPECNPDCNQVNMTSLTMPQTTNVCCLMRRKRTYDTNYDYKQSSKKSRQQDLSTTDKKCHTIKETIHTDDNWEILLLNIHGTSSYHWMQASLDL